MGLFKKPKKDYDTKTVIDIIETYVYNELKLLGFRKFGRTLHRFVSDDISQIINFQAGLPSMGVGGYMWVNIGIRIPECSERSFSPCVDKKYYHEYECTLRSRLGSVRGKKETCYDLSENPDKMARQILKEIQEYVIPVFDVLCDRQTILEKRRKYPYHDVMCIHLIPLEECYIYGRMGNMKKAHLCFMEYYNSTVAEYERKKQTGSRIYLKKGETVIYKDHTIVADRNGHYTVYDADDGHIKHLEELAKKLGFSLE